MDFLKKYHLNGYLSFLVLIIFWCILTYGHFVKPLFFPTPTSVLESLKEAIKDGSYFANIFVSIKRIVIGFCLAAIVALPLGILMGTIKSARLFIEPVISFARYLPAAAFVPVFILYLGIGESAKVAIIIFGTFFYLTMMIMDATKNIDKDLIEVSETMGASRKQLFTQVIFPAAFPAIVDALRTTFGAAWTYLVVAEITGASQGLGYMIMNASRFLKSSDMYLVSTE